MKNLFLGIVTLLLLSGCNLPSDETKDTSAGAIDRNQIATISASNKELSTMEIAIHAYSEYSEIEFDEEMDMGTFLDTEYTLVAVLSPEIDIGLIDEVVVSKPDVESASMSDFQIYSFPAYKEEERLKLHEDSGVQCLDTISVAIFRKEMKDRGIW